MMNKTMAPKAVSKGTCMRCGMPFEKCYSYHSCNANLAKREKATKTEAANAGATAAFMLSVRDFGGVPTLEN